MPRFRPCGILRPNSLASVCTDDDLAEVLRVRFRHFGDLRSRTVRLSLENEGRDQRRPSIYDSLPLLECLPSWSDS